MTQMKLPHPVVLPFQSEKVKQWLYIYKCTILHTKNIKESSSLNSCDFVRWLSVPKETPCSQSGSHGFFRVTWTVRLNASGTRNSEMMDPTRRRCTGLSGCGFLVGKMSRFIKIGIPNQTCEDWFWLRFCFFWDKFYILWISLIWVIMKIPCWIY